MDCSKTNVHGQGLGGKVARVALAAQAPLPIMPKAYLRHDAGRGRGWGYRARATLNVNARARCTLASANNAFSRVFTPPLTPPRPHAGGVSSTRREGDSGVFVAGFCHAA
jgi:hypothetical protein